MDATTMAVAVVVSSSAIGVAFLAASASPAADTSSSRLIEVRRLSDVRRTSPWRRAVGGDAAADDTGDVDCGVGDVDAERDVLTRAGVLVDMTDEPADADSERCSAWGRCGRAA